jgi:hypothetical protein
MKSFAPSRFIAGASCTLLLFGALSTKVKSYATVGHSWGTSQVVYYVNPSNLFVSDSAAIWAFQTAAAAWHDQTGANIQLVYGGTTNGSSLTLNGKNEMFFRNDASSYIGETYWWYDGTGRLVDADMVLHEGYTYFAGSGCSNGIYIEDVAVHEFGHVLGLAHSGVAGATMEPSMPGYCDTTQLTLESDDISGIQSLYPGSPTSQAPAAPSGLAVSINSASPSSSLVVSWSDNANNEDGFRIERSTDGANFSAVVQLGTNARTYADSGLIPGSVYFYRVSAFNNSGNSGYSNVGSAQTQLASTNSAPTVSIGSPSNNSSYGYGASVSFAGSATDTQDGNLTSSVKWTSSIDGQIGTGGSFSRTLSSGTHTITASVTDSGGQFAFSQVTVTVVAAAQPPAPTSPQTGPTLTARGYKVKGNQTADLSWGGLSGSSVDVYRNGGVVSTTANDGAATDNINKKGGGSYTYKVCVSGTSTCTNTVLVSF